MAVGRHFVTWAVAHAESAGGAGLRRVPLLGGIVHRVSQRLSPPGRRDWVIVRSGPGAGLDVLLDTRFEAIVWKGEYEREVLDLLPAFLRPGGVVYDVGAHLGLFSLIAARLVAPGGSVFAFEPDDRNLTRIHDHLERNAATNIEVVPLAAWSANGSVSFVEDTRPTGNQGKATFEPGTAVVQTVTLDHFAATHPAPSLVKIDVEGGEEEVLRGAQSVLAGAGPIVLCEVHLEGGGEAERLGRVTDFLTARGYDVEQLTPDMDPTHLLARPKESVGP